MRIPLRRPSPALVVACIALAIALGGTGYATVLNVPRASVGPAQLQRGAVTTPKLATGAVTSAKVANRSLLRIDFAGGQLPAGPTGPQGPAGPAGPAGAAGPPGLSQVERVETTSASNSTPTRTAFMACPAGKRLIGGGARVNPSPPVSGVAIQQSFPDNDNVFRAYAREIVGTTSNWSLTVFAICATVS
jgi:hypothetical protein